MWTVKGPSWLGEALCAGGASEQLLHCPRLITREAHGAVASSPLDSADGHVCNLKDKKRKEWDNFLSASPSLVRKFWS